MAWIWRLRYMMKISPLGFEMMQLWNMDLLSYSMLLFRRHYLMAMSTTWFPSLRLSKALDMGSNKEASAEAVTSDESRRWRTSGGAFRSGEASVKCVPWGTYHLLRTVYHAVRVATPRIPRLPGRCACLKAWPREKWRHNHNLRCRRSYSQ